MPPISSGCRLIAWLRASFAAKRRRMSGTQVGTEKTEPSFYSFFVCAPVCSVQLVDQSCCWSAEPLPCTAGRCSFIRPDLAFNALWRYMLVPDVFSLYRPTRRTRRQQKKIGRSNGWPPEALCSDLDISVFGQRSRCHSPATDDDPPLPPSHPTDHISTWLQP